MEVWTLTEYVASTDGVVSATASPAEITVSLVYGYLRCYLSLVSLMKKLPEMVADRLADWSARVFMQNGLDSTGHIPHSRIKVRVAKVLQSAISHRQIEEQAHLRFHTWQKPDTLRSLSTPNLLDLGYTAAIFD